MARSVSTIQNSILSAIAADPNLSALNSTSQTAIYNLWAYIVASSQAYEEQLNDQFTSEIESMVTKLAPATKPWIQANVFKFQYSNAVPQIIQFDATSYAPYYTTINAGLQIITNCSITEGPVNIVNVKVAKGGTTATTAQPLSVTELSAFQFYLNQIKPAGIIYNAISIAADRLWTQATVYYNGAYSAVISANLLTAYNNYLNTIPFGGGIKLVDLTLALRNVIGVNDIVIQNMQARPLSTSFGFGYQLVDKYTVDVFPEYITSAGYIIDEDTVGYDFLSQLTLIAS